MILLRKKSAFTGTMNELLLPITQEEFDAYINGESGPVQEAFPQLDADQREFILTGVTKAEWDAVFNGDE